MMRHPECDRFIGPMLPPIEMTARTVSSVQTLEFRVNQRKDTSYVRKDVPGRYFTRIVIVLATCLQFAEH